jgi:DnaJ-class molecular chaperone
VPADPYRVLGVPRDASTEQLHDAYRRRVMQTHPDRPGGSAEAFEAVQEAHETLRRRTRPAQSPHVEDRMAKLEDELRAAHAARERARQAAREAVRDTPEPAPVAEEEDSFGRILEDIVDEVADKLSGARKHPAVRRVSDLIDGLDDLASRLDKH